MMRAVEQHAARAGGTVEEMGKAEENAAAAVVAARVAQQEVVEALDKPKAASK